MINENIDIVILTVIMALLVFIFIMATLKEIAESSKMPFKGGKERGVRADLIEYVGKIFTDENVEPDEKKELAKLMRKKLNDLEDK